MHYEVEVRTASGGWLRRRRQFRLLDEARREAARAEREGGEPRIVQVAGEGTRKVMAG